LARAAAAAGCEVGSGALTAQQAPGDPEVVMRRVLDVHELDSHAGTADDAIPPPGGRSPVMTSWTSSPKGFGNLAILDLETRSLRQITADSSDFTYPIPTAVSPDGQWIAFWQDSRAPDWNYDVRVIRADGSGERTLLLMCCQEDLPISWAEGRAVTPDGRALLVIADMSEADRGAFRTPTLRNVTLTAPYMHDGSLGMLRDVIEFYDGGGEPEPRSDDTAVEPQRCGEGRTARVSGCTDGRVMSGGTDTTRADYRIELELVWCTVNKVI
jgi:hypothetical protein